MVYGLTLVSAYTTLLGLGLCVGYTLLTREFSAVPTGRSPCNARRRTVAGRLGSSSNPALDAIRVGSVHQRRKRRATDGRAPPHRRPLSVLGTASAEIALAVSQCASRRVFDSPSSIEPPRLVQRVTDHVRQPLVESRQSKVVSRELTARAHA